MVPAPIGRPIPSPESIVRRAGQTASGPPIRGVPMGATGPLESNRRYGFGPPNGVLA